MSSQRKIAASRLNGRKSRGPRTVAGKSVVSRNALRHGLAAITHRLPASSNDIERVANALCGSDKDPSLFAQALIVANNELVLRAISAQQLAVVERVRQPSAIALAKGDNSLKLAKARSLKTRQAYDELVALRDRLLEKYKRKLPPASVAPGTKEILPEIDELVPLRLEHFLAEKEKQPLSKAQHPSTTNVRSVAEGLEGRDETAALEEAALDLVRLDRYERRAWSRQKRAMRAFMNMKLMKQVGSSAKPNWGSQTVASPLSGRS